MVHHLTRSAIIAAAGPWYSDGNKTAHQVKEVYGYEVWNPISEYQLSLNIESVIDRKMEALRAHSSQVGGIDYIAAIKGLAKYRGVMSMAGEYAEVFEVLRIAGV